jgi:hypothetical protein
VTDILRRTRLVHREVFNPAEDQHIASLKHFLQTGSWGAIQFHAEAPYTDAPATVMSKWARHSLGVSVENEAEKKLRLERRCVITQAAVELSSAERLASANRLFQQALQTA